MSDDLIAYVLVFALACLASLLVWGVLHFLGMLHNYLMYGYWR